jgi:dipeptidase
LDSTARVVPSQQEFPQLIRPEEKVSLQKLITVLRDHYENTPYYPLNNDTISEKTIASANTRHTTIIQLTNGLPANVGAVMWTGLGSPSTTPYLPFYFGITTVPEPYDKNTPNGQKAYRTFRSLTDRYYDDPGRYADTFPGVWEDFQTKSIREQVKIDQGAMRLYRSRARMAQHFITVNVEGLSQQALDIAKGQLE